MDRSVQRLEGGLTTLAKAQEDTEALSKELEIKNAEIAEKKIIVAELIKDITAKSQVAGVQAKEAAEKKEYLDGQSIIIAREEAEASKALEEAVPALQAAKAALANISSAAITEIKNFAQPPQVVMDVCCIAYYLYPKSNSDGSWANIKLNLLGDTKLLDNLRKYNVSLLKSDAANRAKKKMDKLIKDMGATGEELQRIITGKN